MAKEEDNNIKFRDYINTRWNGYHTIFTDGSVSDDKSVGIGVYIPVINLKFSARLPYHMSICTAETLAIIKALKVIMENEWEKVIICADSRSALERISNINLSYKLDHHTIYCKQILAQLQSQGRTIEFIWIPSHTNIDGNEKADTLAVEGANLEIISPLKCNFTEFIPQIKVNIRQKWQTKWREICNIKGKFYKAHTNELPTKKWFTKSHHSRRAIVTMNRLRSGHSSVKDHLYRIGMADSPLCACGQTQTALHVLFECTNYLDACNELYIALSKKIPSPLNLISVLQNPTIADLHVLEFLDGLNIKL